MWCGVALDNATAVDLGTRPYQRLGMHGVWFPRACPAHAERGAS